MSTNCTQLDEMTEPEKIAYVSNLMEHIQKRQAQQQAYLDRRAARGSSTPTDDLYKQYILLDDAILEVFKRLVSEPVSS